MCVCVQLHHITHIHCPSITSRIYIVLPILLTSRTSFITSRTHFCPLISHHIIPPSITSRTHFFPPLQPRSAPPLIRHPVAVPEHINVRPDHTHITHITLSLPYHTHHAHNIIPRVSHTSSTSSVTSRTHFFPPLQPRSAPPLIRHPVAVPKHIHVWSRGRRATAMRTTRLNVGEAVGKG